MRFGLFLQPVHPPTEHPTVALHRDLDLVTHLDALGYDEVWVGEHHSTGWENIGSPEVFIAAAAERTRSIRFGTGVIQAGMHHPLVLLDRMILLDHLTRGRVMFGVGIGGGLPSDLRVFGIDREVAGQRLQESLDVMVRLLESEEPIDEKSDWFELHSAVLQMGPYTRPYPMFAVASMDPRNVGMMGRLCGRVLLGPVPEKVPDVLAHLTRGAQAAGCKASNDQINLSAALHLAQTRGEAMSDIKEGAIAEQYDFNVRVNGAAPPGNPEDWFDSFVSRHLIGTPDDAIERIERLLDLSGGFGGLLFTSRDWAGPDASRRSWELFARHVAPAFKGHLSQQVIAGDTAASINHR